MNRNGIFCVGENYIGLNIWIGVRWVQKICIITGTEILWPWDENGFLKLNNITVTLSTWLLNIFRIHNNTNNERKKNSNMKREKLLVKFKWIQQPLPCYLVNALSIFVFFYENGNRKEKKIENWAVRTRFLYTMNNREWISLGLQNTKVEIQFPPPAKIRSFFSLFIRYSTEHQLWKMSKYILFLSHSIDFGN